jgi:hypothetical protein
MAQAIRLNLRLFTLPCTQTRQRQTKACVCTGKMQSFSEFLDVAKEAANQAGEILLEAWDKPRTVQHKGSVDLVRTTS